MMSVNFCVKSGDLGGSISSDHCDICVDREKIGIMSLHRCERRRKRCGLNSTTAVCCMNIGRRVHKH